MSSEKYIGLDVHQATISVAVMDSQGKVVMESILETKASTLLEFFAGLCGSLFVTFEEGTWASWLYDLLKPHVTEVLVLASTSAPRTAGGRSQTHHHRQAQTDSRPGPNPFRFSGGPESIRSCRVRRQRLKRP